mmetsp:Transcript_4441/g.6257  ORF Transcript_4441/g.6257 Transcript_4441/m.6257 type:complete len:574 (+) Transcript_4441:3-1724(+)
MMDNTLLVRNATFVGYSSAYRTLWQNHKQTTPIPCYSPLGYQGIQLHMCERDQDMGFASLENNTFTSYVSGCNAKAAAIAMNPDTVRCSNFNTKISIGGQSQSFSGVGESDRRVNLCEAQSAGIMGVSIADTEGAFDPTGAGQAGFIVSLNSDLYAGRTCTEMPSSCASHCVDSTASTFVNQFVSPSTTTETVTETGTGTGTESGSESGSGTTTSTTPPPPTICLSNNDFNLGKSFWRAVNTNGGLSIATGPDGSTALRVSDRKLSYTGSIWQDIPSSCLTADAWYVITADVKMIQKGTDALWECNPSNMWNNDALACAGIAFYRSKSRPGTKEVAFTVGPYSTQQNGWNKIYGVFQATADLMIENSLGFYVGRAAIDADITVDNISLLPVETDTIGLPNCNAPLFNGDAELGDHRFWWIYGQNFASRIQVIPNGYDSSGYYFRHSGTREVRQRGMYQKMDNSCFVEGSTWSLTAQFRFMDEAGTFVNCTRTGRGSEVTHCPRFHFLPGGEMTNGKLLVNENQENIVIGDWNEIRSTYTIESATVNEEMHLLVNSVDPGFNYDLDQVVLTRIG